MFLMLVENELEDVDFPKMLKMAMLHDLPELYAGDTNPYRSDTRHKEVHEKAAANKLFSKLPEHTAHSFAALFDEYTAQQTREAQLVKSADKLMPLIQNLCTSEQRSAYRDSGVEYAEAVNYLEAFFSDGVFKEYYRRLLSQARARGVFYTPEPATRLS
ncbi:HD domain-containing protein [Vreelandella sp. EE7]